MSALFPTVPGNLAEDAWSQLAMDPLDVCQLSVDIGWNDLPTPDGLCWSCRELEHHGKLCW